MTSLNRGLAVSVLTLGMIVSPLAAAAQLAVGVSPGSVDEMPAIEGRCPACSWVELAGTAFYELVVYELAEYQELDGGADLHLEDAAEVLYTRVPGGATSWTPELGLCLVPGGRYVWFVRAVFDEADGVVLDASEWSEGLFFSVASAPSVEEVEQALHVLRRYVEDGGQNDVEVLFSENREPASTIGEHRVSPARVTGKFMPAGTAAIRGEMPDPVGETYGVWGTTHSSTDGSRGVIGYADATGGKVYGVGGVSDSPDGAGVVAFNSSEGPDLELMSSAGAGAYLRESGIDRPWPTPQTFEITNSGGGGMTVEVDGVEVVTTDTDKDTIGGLNCANDEVAKWTGSAWACAPDRDTDTDTLAFLGSRCLSGEIPRWDGSRWICDEDNDALGALNCGFPGRIAKWNGSEWACAKDNDTTYSFGPGLTVSEGQIVIDPAAFLLQVSVLDGTGDVGQYSSVAIGADGLGLISYYDVTQGDLKVAHCDDLPCTSATITTLDSTGDVGQYTSVAIGADDRGLISYYDATGGNLRVAHCHNLSCTSGTVSTIDSAGDVGQYTSVAIGADGLGLISYTEAPSGDLKVAHCADILCTTAAINTLDYSASYSSVAIGVDGFGLIGYLDEGDGDLMAAHCNDTACSSAALSELDSGISGRPAGKFPSVAIGADGFGLISYLGAADQLKVAHCTDAVCTGPLTELVTVDLSVPADAWTSIAVGANGRPLVSYLGSSTGELKAARCNDTRCVSVTPTELMRGGGTVVPGSLAIGADGLGLVTYYEYDFFCGHLKVAHLPLGL